LILEARASSPHDSQQALASSIARAVQLGLPGKDSEEAIQASVKEALLLEARKNEQLLAYLRCALVATVILASAVSFLRPLWLGARATPWWPAGAFVGVWFAVSAGFTVLLARGWYRRWLRRVVPAVDAISITVGFLFLELNFARLGLGSPPGPYLAAAVACSFIAFSGALRLSRSAARLATRLALAAWIVIWVLGSVPSVAAVLTGVLILATGILASRITRVIRNVITDEVTRIRLVQLYGQAQEAIDAREEVLKIVSHDLRNPLSTIAMATDMLLEDPLTEPERMRYLGVIKRQGESMKHLVSDLLDAARVESGRLPIELEVIAVDDLVALAVEMMHPLALDRQIGLENLIPGSLPPVLIDPDRINQVFSNLIGNAIKFTPQGGRISINGVRMGEKVRLSVSDTGPGIPPDQLSSIFGRMWQARKDDTRGIGLGLTIAQAIVEAHGERIGVESQVGEGTEFWFTVPIAEGAVQAELDSAAATHSLPLD
jgi:signal transduction histidine kinase